MGNKGEADNRGWEGEEEPHTEEEQRGEGGKDRERDKREDKEEGWRDYPNRVEWRE